MQDKVVGKQENMANLDGSIKFEFRNLSLVFRELKINTNR